MTSKPSPQVVPVPSSDFDTPDNVEDKDVPQTTALRRLVAYNGNYRRTEDPSKPTDLLSIVRDGSCITHLILFNLQLRSEAPHVTVGGFAPDDTVNLGPLWESVSQLQSHGVKVLGSLGSWRTTAFLDLERDFDTFYPHVHDFLKRYHLDGCDLDIEPGPDDKLVNGPSSIVKLIKRLKHDFGSGFIVTLAPVAKDLTAEPKGFSGFDHKELDALAVDEHGTPLIDWFNVQFYNGWGRADSTERYDEIIAAGWNPARIVFGVLTAETEGNDFYKINNLQKTIATLKSEYPSFGGVGESAPLCIMMGHKLMVGTQRALSGNLLGLASTLPPGNGSDLSGWGLRDCQTY